MLPWILAAAAAVSLTVELVALTVLFWGRAESLDAQVLSEQVAKLLGANNTSRAVRLCSALDPANPARQLLLFMLGLELPAASVVRDGASDYRAAPPVERFEDVVRETVGREATRLRAAPWPSAGAVLGSAVVTVGAGVAGGLAGAQDLSTVAMVLGAAGAIGAVLGLAQALRLRSRVRTLEHAVVPLLLPVEEMSDDRKEAAAAARALLAAPVSNAGMTKVIVGIVATAASGGAIGAFALSQSPVPHGPRGLPERLEARVTSTTGSAPAVTRGTVCTFEIAPHDSEFNCRISIACGDDEIGLYGTESNMGYTQCQWNGPVATSALDERNDDGDPALRFDRDTRFVEVRDASWTVTLELDVDVIDAGGSGADAGDSGDAGG